LPHARRNSKWGEVLVVDPQNHRGVVVQLLNEVQETVIYAHPSKHPKERCVEDASKRVLEVQKGAVNREALSVEAHVARFFKCSRHEERLLQAALYRRNKALLLWRKNSALLRPGAEVGREAAREEFIKNR